MCSSLVIQSKAALRKRVCEQRWVWVGWADGNALRIDEWIEVGRSFPKQKLFDVGSNNDADLQSYLGCVQWRT